MTLRELIALYRAEAADLVEPYLCQDELAAAYANEAQVEACRRGRLLVDSGSAMCMVPFAAGATSVAMDPCIVRVLRARIAGRDVVPFDVENMDAGVPGWQDAEARDVPSRLVFGLSSDRAYLWPRPASDGVLRMTVQRLPLEPMKEESDAPEIRPELHRALVQWMKWRVYTQQDAELFAAGSAAAALAEFEAEFGRKASGRNEEWARQGVGLMPGPIA